MKEQLPVNNDLTDVLSDSQQTFPKAKESADSVVSKDAILAANQYINNENLTDFFTGSRAADPAKLSFAAQTADNKVLTAVRK